MVSEHDAQNGYVFVAAGVYSILWKHACADVWRLGLRTAGFQAPASILVKPLVSIPAPKKLSYLVIVHFHTYAFTRSAQPYSNRDRRSHVLPLAPGSKARLPVRGRSPIIIILFSF